MDFHGRPDWTVNGAAVDHCEGLLLLMNHLAGERRLLAQFCAATLLDDELDTFLLFWLQLQKDVTQVALCCCCQRCLETITPLPQLSVELLRRHLLLAFLRLRGSVLPG